MNFEHLSLNEKECELEDEDEQVIELKLEKVKNGAKVIPLADDVLRKLLEWIPLPRIPIINFTNRKFWLFCDEKEYQIQQMDISAEPDRLFITEKIGDKFITRSVPFAEVAPPPNFKVTLLRVHKNIGKKALEFMQISKQLFVGATLEFISWKKICKANSDPDGSLDIFDQCSEIKYYPISSSHAKEDFVTKSILNCNSLWIDASYNEEIFDFDQNSILLEWLHTPPTLSPNAIRQVCFRNWENHIPKTIATYTFISQIKKTFLADTDKHKFVVVFYRKAIPNLETFHLVNQRTEEVLFLKGNGFYWDLIRCNKDEEKMIKYQKIDEKLHTSVEIFHDTSLG